MTNYRDLNILNMTLKISFRLSLATSLTKVVHTLYHVQTFYGLFCIL